MTRGLLAIALFWASIFALITCTTAPKKTTPRVRPPFPRKVEAKPTCRKAPLVVAVIDTGTDINHELLNKYIWTNPGETGKDAMGRDKSNNGIDDDGNGFIDDVHGWNFVDNNNDLKDIHGHGTHIAGTIIHGGISAKQFHGYEATSEVVQAWRAAHPKNEVQLMILRYYNPKDDTDNLINEVKSIQYATLMHADFINLSGGGRYQSSAETEAVKAFIDGGGTFVTVAGNENKDMAFEHYYPANSDDRAIVAGNGIDQKHRAPTSNWGKRVDKWRNGTNVFSTLPNNQYGYMTGTSQAAAIVTSELISKKLVPCK